MTGGTISGNTSSGPGGGVSIIETGSFTKTGGIIYGNDAPNETDRSTRTSTGNGHAVYWNGTPALYRDATLGATDNLSTGDTDTGWGE